MQIIQSIRDRGAVIVIIVIALSLIGFILMDANSGTGKMFGGSNSSVLGQVNGSAIEGAEFDKKVKQMEAQYGGGSVTGSELNRLRQGVWDQVVAEKLLISEASKLGISFSPDELTNTIYSDDAPQVLKQNFTDPKTGKYDVEKVKEWWKQMKKQKPEDRANVNAQLIEPMRLSAIYTKYNSMISAGAYYPSWMQEKEAADNNTFANISYTYIPYNVISDSAVKVTDADISEYVNKRKAMYTQDEPTRLVSYVAFNANSNAADSNKTRDAVQTLKQAFSADSSAQAFVNRNASTMPFYDGYTLKSKMQMAMKDTIASLAKGSVFGPYLDGNSYVMARMIDMRTMPDSIKCRHILVKIADAQGEVRPDSVARKLIDSIRTAIAGGADFNEMVKKYSDDGGSKETKGEYKFSSTSQLVDSFYRTVFYEPTGTKKIVKGESGGQQGYLGYHYIEVLEQWKQETAYKVAYMAKEISPSEETINMANVQATKLAGSARNLKQLEDYLSKNGLQKVSSQAPLKENDFSLGSLQNARELIRWANGAKEGEVSPESFNIDNQFVVAVVEKIQKAGTPDAATARTMAEPEVRNRKKAAEIIKKIPAGSTVEAAAAAYSRQPAQTGADSSLTFSSYIIKEVGNEPKVIGAAFNKEHQSKPSAPIIGNTGVFVVKVNSYGTKAADSPEMAEQQRKMRIQSMKQQAGGWFDGLKKLATIKDDRSKFF